jgi:hypothetical protein
MHNNSAQSDALAHCRPQTLGANSMEEKDALELLWAEYKYRHTHIWGTTYKITAAIIAVSVVPYIKTEIMAKLGIFMIMLPIVALGLAVLGFYRIRGELKLFDKIKQKYRELQQRELGIAHDPPGSFTRDVRRYMGLLILLAVFNLIYVALVLLQQLCLAPN